MNLQQYNLWTGRFPEAFQEVCNLKSYPTLLTSTVLTNCSIRPPDTQHNTPPILLYIYQDCQSQICLINLGAKPETANIRIHMPDGGNSVKMLLPPMSTGALL